MKRLFVAFIVILSAILHANTAPVVSNITAQQRSDGSFMVDVYYDVYDADGDAMIITMQVSDDDGSTWNLSCNLTSGDIGSGKYSGNGKHIIWNVGAEHPNIQGDDFRFKITAEDGYTGNGTVTDIDGNVYQTLVIGNQEWMAENLKVTHYRNGDQIPHVTNNSTWAGLSTGAYCVYNNTPSNADTYGNLYNWYAVDDARGLAPDGWHVPTDEEIMELEMYLGMTYSEAHGQVWRGTNEGSKLAGRADLWSDGALENDPEFGSSGFDFLPGGYRSSYPDGIFDYLGMSGRLWSSSGLLSSFGRHRRLAYDHADVYRDYRGGSRGFSVRCVRDSRYAISGPVSINTIGNSYSSYRIVEVSQAPNPAILEIPEGGIGYAWFVVEGELDGVWLPVPNIEVLAEDGQGNIVQCHANILPFQFLTTPYHFQNAGVFCIPIPAFMVGSGNVGDYESFTVTTANGETISPANQQDITAEVVEYEYTASWGYRIYAKGGAGLTGGVVTATAFAGGGSGSKIELILEGTSTNPDWNSFKIFRRDDIFFGVEVELGPPTLIDTGIAPSVEVKASFPYQHEFEFDMDDLEGLEALMAYYLFAEPSILYAGVIPGGQIVTNFLSWTVEALIENSAQNGLGIARISDEAGLDIEGSLDFSCNILENLPLGMSMGASLGANAHLGGSKRVTESNEINRRLYVGGGYNFSIGIGPKLIPETDMKCKMIYPARLMNAPLPSNLEVNFEYYGTWQNTSWQSTKLSASLASDSAELNVYNLPGQLQEYKAWINIDNIDLKNTLLNEAELPSEMWNIGSSAVNVAINSESFKQDFVDFLGVVYDEQNDDLPVQLQYGFDAEDKSEYSIDLDLEFPLPVLPAIVINLGGGIEATNSREYELSQGYWVKGLPYLQTEMPNPPQPGETFVGVMQELWNQVTSGNVWQELVDVVVSHLSGSFFGWTSDTDQQMINLNDRGSTLTIRENSIPAGTDSVLYRNWEWDEEPESSDLSTEQRRKIKRYNTKLRELREEIAGMKYGIGGFFKFEPTGVVMGDSTLLSIAYADSEVIDLNEQHLSIYWEDEQGVWQPVTSIVFPDSNLVKAWMPDFQTYTIAPRLPQGNFGLISNPDSIAADGVSTAIVTSEALYNNDGTIIEDGQMFTVESTRGVILSADEDLNIDGIQVSVNAGIIQFEVQSDSLSVPIELTANSVQGYATCQMELDLYDVSVPDTPVLLFLQPEHNSLQLSWQEVTAPDLAGYKIYFDIDESGEPYNGTANYQGENSPVIVGQISNYLLTGLSNNETYYVAITSFDVSGVESTYSNELTASPELNAVESLQIILLPEGAKLQWNPVEGANSYRIYRSTNPTSDTAQMEMVQETSSTSWVDADALSADKYFYVVVVVAY